MSHDHHHGHHAHRDSFRNPEEFEHYLERLESPERAEWQRPDAVVAALRLEPGARVCDLGAGPGYFTLRLARAVGLTGKVYAIEAEARMREVLVQRLEEAHAANVVPVLAVDGVGVPPEPVDRILIVNAYHHFPDGIAYLRALAGHLRPGGTVVNIDFGAGEQPIGPPPELRISRERFLADAEAAGFRLVGEETFLPYQYFVSLAPDVAARRG